MDFQEQIVAKTDQELLDIYVNSDQYQENFSDFAHQELIKRGVSLEKYQKEKESRFNTTDELLEKGKKGNDLYIVLGFISALLGGLIGIIAGYTYSQSKLNSPSGKRYYVYDKKTRETGRIMMTIGILMLLITIIWQAS